jgi:DNA-binding protein HU-beta
MNKGELINEVAKELSSKKEAQAAVDAVLGTISSALKNGDSVTLIGFGTFKVVERKARKGRNPQTGKEIMIEAKKVPKFTPGSSLKEAVQ